MAQATLQEMSREIHLYSSEVCPILLAQRWIRDIYRKILRRSVWSFKLSQGQFSTIAQYNTGTITLTNASSTVTGSGTAWTSALAGNQLKVNNTLFTINSVTNGTTLVIDRNWSAATTAGLSYTILTAYITPTDVDSVGANTFKAFYSVIDPASGVSIALGEPIYYIDTIDPNRTTVTADPVLALRGADPGVVTASLAGVPQFELWPHVTTQKQYAYVFEKIMPDLVAATDTPNPIIRSDVIIRGALMDLVRWPGTPDVKNPMYDQSFAQYKNRSDEFEAELSALQEADFSRVRQMLAYYNNRWSGF